MDKLSLRIEGLYDMRTYQCLEALKVKQFSFDFRPRSLAFVQGHRFLEILEKSLSLELQDLQKRRYFFD